MGQWTDVLLRALAQSFFRTCFRGEYTGATVLIVVVPIVLLLYFLGCRLLRALSILGNRGELSKVPPLDDDLSAGALDNTTSRSSSVGVSDGGAPGTGKSEGGATESNEVPAAQSEVAILAAAQSGREEQSAGAAGTPTPMLGDRLSGAGSFEEAWLLMRDSFLTEGGIAWFFPGPEDHNDLLMALDAKTSQKLTTHNLGIVEDLVAKKVADLVLPEDIRKLICSFILLSRFSGGSYRRVGGPSDASG